jgi:hypothetical protein
MAIGFKGKSKLERGAEIGSQLPRPALIVLTGSKVTHVSEIEIIRALSQSLLRKGMLPPLVAPKFRWTCAHMP